MATAVLTGYADAAAVIAALDKATNAVQSSVIDDIITITQADYDALETKVATRLYLIVEALVLTWGVTMLTWADTPILWAVPA